MDEPRAFYLPNGDGSYESTPATASPWDADLQHGGPPSALLAHAILTGHPRDDVAISRFSVDFLGPIAQGRMTLATEVIRPGRRIELVEARLAAAGRQVAVARAWRIQIGSAQAPAFTVATPAAYALPVEPQPQQHAEGIDPDWGYGRAVEFRFVAGAFDVLGPAVAWARPKLYLVGGEPTSPLEQALIVIDSANGISAELGFRDWLFIPPGLTVTFYREPAGPWVLLDARTRIDPRGTGMTHATLFDATGEFGVATQPLLVERRPHP